jgi:ABC-2 type transport system ATP-binding protein
MIRLEAVSRAFGSRVAVDAVSFALQPGEIAALLGPNGAGKTTLLRLLSTWLAPSSGRLEVAGHDAVHEPLAVRRAVGYLAAGNALYEEMRVGSFLRFAGKVRGLRGGGLADRIAWLLERCGLAAVAGERIGECSQGFRQRVGLAACLIHDPPVLLLDEPTLGLDPLQAADFRELLGELRPGRTILLSSHLLGEVTALAGRVLVLQRGRLVADRTLAELDLGSSAAAGCTPEQAVLDLVRSAAAP